MPEPTRAAADEEDALRGDRPLLAVVPTPERQPAAVAPAGVSSGSSGAYQQQQGQPQQQHVVQLYSLRSQGYVRSLSFSGEVLGVAASARLLLVALRGQLQAFDAASLRHTFSCLTYSPPTPSPPLLPAGSGDARRSAQQQQFVTEGLTSSTGSDGSDGPLQHHAQQQAGAAAPPPPSPAAALAPFALGPRWLAYAADTPVPAASGQAVAQRLPLARRDSGGSSAFGSPDVHDGAALGSSPGAAARGGSLTAAAADAARAAAAKGGQQLRAGLAAVGSASFKYLSQQYAAWRQGQAGQLSQRDLDALEASGGGREAGQVLLGATC